MRIGTLYWVFALALIGALFGLRHEVVRSHMTIQNNQLGQSSAGPTFSNSNTPHTELLNEEITADLNERSLMKVAQSSGYARSPVTVVANHNYDKVSLEAAVTSDPASVIGRAFPVSASVDADCKKRQDDICNDITQNLARMRQEPRDLMWARDTEALIRHDVLQEEQPGWFRIRHIECRTVTCAAEVESKFIGNGTYGPYAGGIQAHHDALKAALRTYLSTFAYETDSSGARITVTLITFTRLETHE